MNIILKTECGKTRRFWTNASNEMVVHTMRTCYNKYNMIMKWDRENIKHDLDWVSYHLRRFGYKITPTKKNIHKKIYENVKPMLVSKIH